MRKGGWNTKGCQRNTKRRTDGKTGDVRCDERQVFSQVVADSSIISDGSCQRMQDAAR